MFSAQGIVAWIWGRTRGSKAMTNAHSSFFKDVGKFIIFLERDVVKFRVTIINGKLKEIQCWTDENFDFSNMDLVTSMVKLSLFLLTGSFF